MRDPRLLEFAKQMRREPTEAESRLWNALRAKRFDGIKFRHQKIVGPYVTDFAAREPMVVIEIDGDTHALQRGYDDRRTRFLESEGYRVIRFNNADVVENLEGVLTQLRLKLGAPPLPTLSPEGERAL